MKRSLRKLMAQTKVPRSLYDLLSFVYNAMPWAAGCHNVTLSRIETTKN